MVLAKRQRPSILSRRHWFAFANYLGVIGYICNKEAHEKKILSAAPSVIIIKFINMQMLFSLPLYNSKTINLFLLKCRFA